MFANFSFAQILTPTDEACPNEIIDYVITKSGMSGEEEFGISNGKFIVNDSLYHVAPWATVIDSTFIIVDVDEIDSIQIIWTTGANTGTVYWYETNEPATSQNYNIYSSIFSRLMEADTAVAGGTNNFKIKVMEYDAETNNQIVSTSNNTSLIGHKQTLIELTEDMVHDYTFQITGYEDGWVQFSTSGPASNDCPNITSEIIKS